MAKIVRNVLSRIVIDIDLMPANIFLILFFWSGNKSNSLSRQSKIHNILISGSIELYFTRIAGRLITAAAAAYASAAAAAAAYAAAAAAAARWNRGERSE